MMRAQSNFPAIYLVFLVALLTALPLNVSAQDEENAFLPEMPLEGRRLFSEKLCIRCHSIQGVGGRTGPDLGDVPLGGLAAIAGALWNHFPRMIEAFRKDDLDWPQFDEDESRQLFAFLYFLNFFDKTSRAEVGERLFYQKNCIRCHSVGGKGGDVGPELDDYQSRHAAPYISAALWNKGPAMMAAMKKHNVPRPTFQERDVMDILSFIRARGLSTEIRRDYLPPPNPLQGRTLFVEKKCSQCHAVRGEGGSIGPDLAKANLKGSLSHILSQMWNHGSNMWPKMKSEGIEFPEFSPEEMSDLVAYLYFIQFEDGAGSISKGARVFEAKKCRGCHISDSSEQEPIGPNLAEVGLESPFHIIAAMWNHAPAIAGKMKDENIRWPILKRSEMRDLMTYLLSLQ